VLSDELPHVELRPEPREKELCFGIFVDNIRQGHVRGVVGGFGDGRFFRVTGAYRDEDSCARGAFVAAYIRLLDEVQVSSVRSDWNRSQFAEEFWSKRLRVTQGYRIVRQSSEYMDDSEETYSGGSYRGEPIRSRYYSYEWILSRTAPLAS